MVETSKQQYLRELLFECLEIRRENEFFDLKLIWHKEI